MRAIVTDALTGQRAERLTRRAGRRLLKRRIKQGLAERTDVEAVDVLFTDLTVQ